MKKIKSLAMLLLGLSIAFTSCEKEPDPIPVTGITLDSSSLTLTEGETARLNATISPSNADNQGVIWSSSDASVASVSNGTVTALSAGSATITAKSDDGGKTATCEVTVNPKYIPVNSIELDLSEVILKVGEVASLKAIVMPENATEKNIKWSSSDVLIATVNEGVITALKAGQVEIIAVAGDITAICSVIVLPEISVPEVVDLGLSVKWASINLGATKPEETGHKFAWGEIYPKTEFTKENYKYEFSSSRTELDPEHDAATVLLGNNWRMPTNQEAWELEDKCTYEKVEANGVSIAKFIGPNGNFILMPIEPCYYWTSSCSTSLFHSPFHMYLYYKTTYHDVVSYHYELSCSGAYDGYLGHCIRPVYIGTE